MCRINICLTLKIACKVCSLQFRTVFLNLCVSSASVPQKIFRCTVKQTKKACHLSKKVEKQRFRMSMQRIHFHEKFTPRMSSNLFREKRRNSRRVFTLLLILLFIGAVKLAPIKSANSRLHLNPHITPALCSAKTDVKVIQLQNYLLSQNIPKINRSKSEESLVLIARNFVRSLEVYNPQNQCEFEAWMRKTQPKELQVIPLVDNYTKFQIIYRNADFVLLSTNTPEGKNSETKFDAYTKHQASFYSKHVSLEGKVHTGYWHLFSTNQRHLFIG